MSLQLSSSLIILPIVFMNNQLIFFYPMKCWESVKNAHLIFPEPDGFFCPNSSEKHKDSFMIRNKTEMQQIVSFKRLNQQFFSRFSLKNT